MIKRVIPIALVASIFLLGCVDKRVNSEALAQSQKSYEAMKKDTLVVQYAPSSLFQAGKLYNLSKSSSSQKEADHYAYLLNREIEVAQESARAKMMQEREKELRIKKVKVLLDAKESELLAAREDVQRAKERALGLEQKYKELQELNAKMTSRGLVLTLGDVLFETNRAQLMIGAQRAMEKLVDFLSENESRKVLIEGHTDNVGSVTYNIDLSLRRANAVASLLQDKGVDSSRIVTKGYGEQYPVASNATASGKQQNRRVEIVILHEGALMEDAIR